MFEMSSVKRHFELDFAVATGHAKLPITYLMLTAVLTISIILALV